jgi:transcriptional regulator of arginine metabolism
VPQDSTQRLNALRNLLLEGKISTQEELVQELRAQKFTVTQSTISRDLARLGATKTRDNSGRVIYRLLEESLGVLALPASDLKGLLVNVQDNGSIIVIHTPPGSANLVAHQLDRTRPAGILGTIAGDDTIFIAPRSTKLIKETIEAILALFE